jgi:hypothetical protein
MVGLYPVVRIERLFAQVAMRRSGQHPGAICFVGFAVEKLLLCYAFGRVTFALSLAVVFALMFLAASLIRQR